MELIAERVKTSSERGWGPKGGDDCGEGENKEGRVGA